MRIGLPLVRVEVELKSNPTSHMSPKSLASNQTCTDTASERGTRSSCVLRTPASNDDAVYPWIPEEINLSYSVTLHASPRLWLDLEYSA